MGLQRKQLWSSFSSRMAKQPEIGEHESSNAESLHASTCYAIRKALDSHIHAPTPQSAVHTLGTRVFSYLPQPQLVGSDRKKSESPHLQCTKIPLTKKVRLLTFQSSMELWNCCILCNSFVASQRRGDHCWWEQLMTCMYVCDVASIHGDVDIFIAFINHAQLITFCSQSNLARSFLDLTGRFKLKVVQINSNIHIAWSQHSSSFDPDSRRKQTCRSGWKKVILIYIYMSSHLEKMIVILNDEWMIIILDRKLVIELLVFFRIHAILH